MKTNEADTPWDPKPEDQKVEGSSKRLKEGVDQLERDTLRFLELIPDIKMANIKIATNVAFPLAEEASERALTQGDFELENAKGLLEKLGVPKEYLQSRQQSGLPAQEKGEGMDEHLRADGETSFQKIVCRYLGAHAKVSAKTEIDTGLGALELAIKGAEGGFDALEPSLVNPCDEEEVKSMRKAVADDSRMKEIRRAVLIPKFGTKFKERNPNIPLKELKSDSKRFLRHLPTKSYPLFGIPVIKAVIGAADNDVVHQGAEVVIELLEKEKHLFYDDKGDPLDMKTTVDERIQDCEDCSVVQEIKRKLPPNEKHLLDIPTELEHEVLLFADRRHRGFAEAYRRVKSWADFPDCKRKVVLQFARNNPC